MKKDFLLIFSLACLILLPQLGTYPLFPPDEARYVEIPREMLMHHDYLIPRLNDIIYLEKPPLFYWLQAVSLHVFGLHEWAFRFMNALLAALCCAMVYVGGAKLYDRRTGLWSAGIFFSSLLFVVFSHLITLDMTLTTFITVTLICSDTAFQERPGLARRLGFWLAYIAAAAAVMTKGLVGVLLPALIMAIVMTLQRSWHQLKTAYLPSGLLIFLALVLPWHVWVQQQVPEFFNYYILEHHFSRYLTEEAGRHEPFWFFGMVLLLGLLPWTFFTMRGMMAALRTRTHAAVFLLTWALVVVVFFSVSQSKLIPYILPALPPLCILTAHTVASHERQRALAVMGVVCAVSASIALPVWVNYLDRSVKPLALAANQYLKDTDALMTYGQYYQDLPVYTQRPSLVVGQLDELAFGSTLEDHGDKLIGSDCANQLFNYPDYRAFVIISQKKYDHHRQYFKIEPRILAKTQKHLLITNQDIAP